MIKFIDLFCGLGGFRIALERNNSKCVFSCDIDKNARDIYNLNFNEFPYGDIYTIPSYQIPDHDILTGGFPCQAFSKVGKIKGFKDKRGVLIFEILRILKDKKPKAFLLENVPNIISVDNNKIISKIILRLQKTGYNVYAKLMKASEYGNLPQIRERIYIIGFLKNLGIKFNFPKKIELTNTIDNILRPLSEKQDDKFYFKNNKHFFILCKNYKRLLFRKGYIYNIAFFKVSEHKISPTLLTSCRLLSRLDNYGLRVLTERELFNLQGFPTNYIIPNFSRASICKLIGNSVAIPVVSRIAFNIIKELKNKI